MNILFLLLLLGGNNGGNSNCNNNSNHNSNDNCGNNCGCDDSCSVNNIMDMGCGNMANDCGCGMDAFDGRMMEPRMDARMDARMDTRPFMTFQGGTCGCEDNSQRQNNNNG